jgi:hypothetical protein
MRKDIFHEVVKIALGKDVFYTDNQTITTWIR